MLIFLLDRPHPSAGLPALGPLLDPVAGFWANADVPAEDGAETELDLVGLDAEGRIVYDGRGVPHIYASNLRDAVFLQGYVTARDRLWQMEFQTHAAAGRLSEILGPDLEPGDGLILRNDRYQRRIGLGAAAERAMEAMQDDGEMQLLLDAYTAGINAWVNSLEAADYPLEFKLLGYKPEGWSRYKTGLLLKMMGNMLTAREYDIEYTNMLARLGEKDFEMLFPDQGGNRSPIIPEGTPWPFEAVRVAAPVIDSSLQSFVPDLALDLAPDLEHWPQTEKPYPGIGSNNWAVHGDHTASGNTILANDPHLALNLPSIWYECHIRTPEHAVYGATLPGSPGIIIGFNRHIAWGVTNAGRDVRDWYRIQFRDDSRQEYLFEGEWLKAEYRVEEIGLQDGSTFTDSVCWTRHGPVVFDPTFRGREHDALQGYALRWELHQPSNEQRAIFGLNTASNHQEYRDAIQYFQCPAQNFVFADVHGDIAITQQGRFPARWPQQGRFLLDGSRADHDWQAYIPFEHNATIRNPERGFVSSANQFPADSTYPYYQLGNFAKFRNWRINEELERLVQRGEVRIEDLQNLQLDNFNEIAEELLPVLLEVVPEATDELGDWDYYHHADSRQAARFESWFDTLSDRLWDEFDTLSGPKLEPLPYATMIFLIEEKDSDWYDIVATPQKEGRRDLLLKAWEESSVDMDWASYKSTDVLHLLPTLEPFAAMDLISGGNARIVNATSERHGPSWRMVVEMSDPPVAYGVYPGGQSGNPGSADYDDFIDEWSVGEYFRLEFAESPEDLSSSREVLVLKPSSK